MWKEIYHMPPFEASINYLSITIGLVIGCELAGPLNDKVSVVNSPSVHVTDDFAPIRSIARSNHAHHHLVVPSTA